MQAYSLTQWSRQIWRAGLIAGSLCACAAAAQSLPGQPALSVQAAVRAALARSPALAVSDAAASAARNMAVAAAQRPDPVLSLSLNNLPVSGPDRFSTTADFMTMRSASLMQTFTREDKRLARASRFEREADVAMAERAARSAEIGQQTAVAWLERHAQEQRVLTLQAQRAEAGLQVQSAEAAVRSGRGSTTEALAARDAVAQLQQALIVAEAELVNARQALVRWTGGPPDQLLAAAPVLTHTRFASEPPDAALARHPELQSLAARESAAAAEAEVARLERKPDWTGELMFSQRGAAYSNMVSVAVSVPLQWDRPKRQDRELAAQLARVEGLRAEQEDMLRAKRAQTQAWVQSWRAGLAQLALIDRERLPLAGQRTELALAAYRGGQGSLAEVLAARRMALALQFERIDSALAAGRLWAQLDYALPLEENTLTHSPEALAP